jgi:serine/threonine-protein kinase RsbW
VTAPSRFVIRRTPDGADGAGPVRVVLDLPCDVSCIEEAVEAMALHCFAGRCPVRRTAFRFRVALAEALANAMRAGGGCGPGRRVEVIAELHPDSVRLGVTDQGNGFDPGDLPDPTLPDTLERECGRGIFLIRSLADHVEFNDRGNAIWMTLPRS